MATRRPRTKSEIAEMDRYFEPLHEKDPDDDRPWPELTRLQRNRRWWELSSKYGPLSDMPYVLESVDAEAGTGPKKPGQRPVTPRPEPAPKATSTRAGNGHTAHPAGGRRPYQTPTGISVRLSPSPWPDPYPSGWRWMGAGINRQRIPALIALCVSWSGFWVILWIMFFAALAGAVIGILASEGLAGSLPLPMDAQLVASRGLAPVAAAIGASYLVFAVIYWWLTNILLGDPFMGLASIAVSVMFCVLIVVIASAVEPWTLKIRGYRRMSDRERRRIATGAEADSSEIIGPFDATASGLLIETAREMGLATVPRILVDDSSFGLNAWTHMRHIVLSQSLGLHEHAIEFTDQELCGVLAHELEHWRTGEVFGRQLLWACSLPVALLYNLGVFLSGGATGQDGTATKPARGARPILSIVGWTLLWPTWVIIRYIIQPVSTAYFRRQEYDADRAAVDAGYGDGLRAALDRRKSFEVGRTGWEAAIIATHPPIELRIEAIDRRMNEINSMAPRTH